MREASYFWLTYAGGKITVVGNDGKELRFELTGIMNRYVWSIDNKVLSETDKIPVEKGEILRITLFNNSMMRHPMHLHGYDFRLLNDHGEYSPLNEKHGYEVETHLGRYIGKMQWLMPFVGFDWRYRKMGEEQEKNLFGQVNNKDERSAVSLGVLYTLPMLVNFQAEAYHDGIVRLSLMREDIPISKRFRAGFMVNTDSEYLVGLNYIIGKNFGIRTHYDSDMGFGVGLTLNY